MGEKREKKNGSQQLEEMGIDDRIVGKRGDANRGGGAGEDNPEEGGPFFKEQFPKRNAEGEEGQAKKDERSDIRGVEVDPFVESPRENQPFGDQRQMAEEFVVLMLDWNRIGEGCQKSRRDFFKSNH